MMILSTFSFPTPEDAGIKKGFNVFSHMPDEHTLTHTHTPGSHIKGKLCDVFQ